jgi:hypothetical protein
VGETVLEEATPSWAAHEQKPIRNLSSEEGIQPIKLLEKLMDVEAPASQAAAICHGPPQSSRLKRRQADPPRVRTCGE